MNRNIKGEIIRVLRKAKKRYTAREISSKLPAVSATDVRTGCLRLFREGIVERERSKVSYSKSHVYVFWLKESYLTDNRYI